MNRKGIKKDKDPPMAMVLYNYNISLVLLPTTPS